MKQREIKFRAFNKRKKEMIFNPICNDIGISEYVSLNEVIERLKKVNCILMQYTGLKDKKGKEIYEGDIVKFKTRALISCIIKYDIDMSSFMIHGHNCTAQRNFRDNLTKKRARKFEVIGNIYENKELLK